MVSDGAGPSASMGTPLGLGRDQYRLCAAKCERKSGPRALDVAAVRLYSGEAPCDASLEICRMNRVLLTSFEPFGPHAVNSSLEIGRVVADQPPSGVSLDWLVLQVVAGLSTERAWERVMAFEPDLILALGQGDSRAGLHVEMRAVNVADFAIPDNA